MAWMRWLALAVFARSLGDDLEDVAANIDNMSNITDVGLEDAPLPPIGSLSPEVWHVLTPPASSGAVCLDGSPFSFVVVPRPNATRVVFELLGGYACWNDVTCGLVFDSADKAIDPLMLALDGQSAAFVEDKVGLDLLYDEPGLADATYVLLPYCTMDIHLGSATANYTVDQMGRSAEHRGWANVQSAVQWVKANYDNDDTEIVAGAMAGPLVAASLADAFDRVTILADSFVGVASEKFVRDHLYGTWGAACAFGDALPGLNLSNSTMQTAEVTIEFWRHILRSHPNLTVGVYTALHDETQMTYLLFMRGVLNSTGEQADKDRFARLAVSMLDELRDEFPDQFTSFVVEGEAHCNAALDVALTHDGFRDWAAQLVAGIVPEPVACPECKLDVIDGCDGVEGSLKVEEHCMTCDAECPEPEAATFTSCANVTA
ncbi:hypothetical protein M885DRAFT_574897 [Pelagophyceae sp. CCMP2097]|nr:hypothetical protein M885DRAFT_574897 [Pelagophyceae sp. CCMP2097]